MPDLLVLSNQPDLNLELYEFAKKHGFRVKTTSQLAITAEWLELRKFDLMFAHAAMPLQDQIKLAGLLWQRNLAARLIVFDFETANLKTTEPRLYGAEIARGPNARAFLEQAVIGFKPAADINSQELRVMVVEDLESPRDIICIFIESLGYDQVVARNSAAEALAELRKDPGKFVCVVTDIKMPQMTGSELIREIRKDARLHHLPVLVLTAFGTADCLVDCLKSGASGFLVKPPKKEDMRRELGRAARILNNGLDPRLVSEGDAEALKKVLEDKGFV